MSGDPKRIAFINQKGGSGKTSCAIHLAGSLARNGTSCLIVDADPQGSALTWYGQRVKVHGDASIGAKIEVRDLKGMAGPNGHLYNIVDCPPALEGITRAALVGCSLVLMPISPSPLDYWSAMKTVALAEEAKRVVPGLKVRVLINRVPRSSTIGSEMRDQLAKLGLQVLRAEISERIDVVRSLFRGQTIFEYAPNSPAAQEFASVEAEVQQLLNGEDSHEQEGVV